MICIGGLYWPDDTGTKWEHSLRHVRAVEWAIAACPKHRTAIQAGGNIGLWPLRMAKDFGRVFTFEPEPISRQCLEQNVPRNVIVSGSALGAEPGFCGVKRRSLGSHHIVEGTDVAITPIDALQLDDVDLIQLDIEGYELNALMGAVQTIEKCHPVIQVELRGFTEKYGWSESDVRTLLVSLGYHMASQQPGSDFVFQWVGKN